MNQNHEEAFLSHSNYFSLSKCQGSVRKRERATTVKSLTFQSSYAKTKPMFSARVSKCLTKMFVLSHLIDIQFPWQLSTNMTVYWPIRIQHYEGMQFQGANCVRSSTLLTSSLFCWDQCYNNSQVGCLSTDANTLCRAATEKCTHCFAK